MGFLSKLFKKAKPFLPIALSMFGPGLMASAAGSTLGAKLGLGSLFSGMNPMAANMLKQSALGYGTAALSGSKRPGKAAMYAGLASLPFSYMSASQAANRFNQDYGKMIGEQRHLISGAKPMEQAIGHYRAAQPEVWGLKDITGGGRIPKMSAWDVLLGEKSYAKKYGLDPETFKGIKTPDYSVPTDEFDPERLLVTSPDAPGDSYRKLITGEYADLPSPDIFSKTTPLKEVYNPKLGTSTFTGGEQVANWLPTAASQAAALYGGRMTPEEEWEAAQKKRKKELAWMYGVPEDMIEGEMTNPWASGGFWNKGGIASLENGGDVSGPGTGTSDSINANLSDGEFVMTAKAVENLGGGDRYAGARKMYDLMNVLDPESESMSEVV